MFRQRASFAVRQFTREADDERASFAVRQILSQDSHSGLLNDDVGYDDLSTVKVDGSLQPGSGPGPSGRGIQPGLSTIVRTHVQAQDSFKTYHPPSCCNCCGDIKGIWYLLSSSVLNILLLVIPLGFVAHYLEWGPALVFSLNLAGLVPLALLMGSVTEDLAIRFGDVIGGLLNATFGNIVEMILAIVALQKGLYVVVATSLLGSILSNLLLVLGMCFFVGGLRYKLQTFNQQATKACASLLFLSCIAIILPTLVHELMLDETHQESLTIKPMSHGTAVVLVVLYATYLFFQLFTHRDLFTGDGGEDQPVLTVTSSVILLGGISVIVAFASEFLTGAIEDLSKDTDLPQAFIGMVILPVAGNACEHLTAVIVAWKGKMDLALGVAVGSSIQIAVFVIPLVVIIAWIQGLPFYLDFDPFATVAITISVIHANFAIADGTSHWMMGMQLLATFVLVSLGFLFYG